MAATSPRDRLLRTLILAVGPSVALTAYACDDGPSPGEFAADQPTPAGAAGTSPTAGAGGSSPTMGGPGGSTLGIGGASGTPGASGASGAAGAGGASGSSPGDAGAGAGGAGAGAGGAGAGGAIAASFPPFPPGTGGGATGYPQCGPDQTKPPGTPLGYHGSCCVDLYCIPLVKGSCPDPKLVKRGLGSGTCGCDTTSGPYDPGDAKPVADSKGTDCCYLAGIIGCDGRPLLIAGIARVAVLAASSSGWS